MFQKINAVRQQWFMKYTTQVVTLRKRARVVKGFYGVVIHRYISDGRNNVLLLGKKLK